MKALTTLTLPSGNKATVGFAGCFTIPFLGTEIAILAPTKELAIAAAYKILQGHITEPLDPERVTSAAIVPVHPSLVPNT